MRFLGRVILIFLCFVFLLVGMLFLVALTDTSSDTNRIVSRIFLSVGSVATMLVLFFGFLLPFYRSFLSREENPDARGRSIWKEVKRAFVILLVSSFLFLIWILLYSTVATRQEWASNISSELAAYGPFGLAILVLAGKLVEVSFLSEEKVLGHTKVSSEDLERIERFKNDDGEIVFVLNRVKALLGSLVGLFVLMLVAPLILWTWKELTLGERVFLLVGRGVYLLFVLFGLMGFVFSLSPRKLLVLGEEGLGVFSGYFFWGRFRKVTWKEVQYVGISGFDFASFNPWLLFYPKGWRTNRELAIFLKDSSKIFPKETLWQKIKHVLTASIISGDALVVSERSLSVPLEAILAYIDKNFPVEVHTNLMFKE